MLDEGSEHVEIDVQNRPAAILAASGTEVIALPESAYGDDTASFYGTYTGYFYVPSGTDNFTFGYLSDVGYTVSGTLTDPDSVEHNFSSLGEEIAYSSPTAGLWKIEISVVALMANFWFKDIPPLVWNYPEYLLVEG